MKYSLLVFVSLAFLGGCGYEYTVALDIESAVLSSPEGEFDMHLLASKDKSIIGRPYNNNPDDLQFHGNDEKHEIVIMLSASEIYSNSVLVSFPSNTKASNSVSVVNSTYRLNGEPERPLEISKFGAPQVGHPYKEKYYYVRSVILRPEPLTRHNIKEHGDGLVDPDRYRDQLEKESYRYVIDLSINGAPYNIDATLRYKVKGQIHFGVPGVP